MTKQFLIQVPDCGEIDGMKTLKASLGLMAEDQISHHCDKRIECKVIELLDAEDLNVESINAGIVEFKRRGGQLSVQTGGAE